MRKFTSFLTLLTLLVVTLSVTVPLVTGQETLELYVSVQIPNYNGQERGLAVDPVEGRVWYSNTGGSLFLVSMADILDGGGITPVEIPITDEVHYWYALAWDPVRDVIWAMDWDDQLQRIYTIDDDTYLSTFQFSYSNLPDTEFGEGEFLDGMGYDPVRDTLWMSEDWDGDVWEVSPTPGPGSTAQLVTHFTTTAGDSGTVASFNYVWHINPDEDIWRTDKDGDNEVVYLLPNTDADAEEDMEFDPITLSDGCLLWVIDRGAPASSKIEAYRIPCDRAVGGEIIPITTLQLLAPYLLVLVVIAGTVGVLYKKRIP